MQRVKRTVVKVAPIPFTRIGLEKSKQEYEELQRIRPAAVVDLQKAREMGDLSENGYYKAARAKLSSIDYNLRRLKHILHYAVVIDQPSTDRVTIGSKVTVSDGKQEQPFLIVGGHESNPLEGKISHVSPIGKALVDHKVGDNVEVMVPAGKIVYEIKKIEIV